MRVRLPPRAPLEYLNALASHTKCTHPCEMARSKAKVELIKDGSTVVRLYTIDRDDRTVYSVASYLEGRRQLKQFSDYAEAKKQAQAIARRLTAGERKVLSLTDDDAWAYERAVGYLAPWGVEVDVATREYSQARHALKNTGSVVEAAKYYQVHHGSRPTKTVRQVVVEFLADRADRGLRYRNDAKFRLNKFADSINLPIADVTPQMVSEWLKSLNVGKRTQFNFLRLVKTLYRYAIDQNYLPEGKTSPDRVKLHVGR